MPIYLFKSILSIFIVMLTLVSMYTMFEVFGRSDNNRKFSVNKLKTIHKINGYLFLGLFLYIAFLCLKILMGTHAEPASRVVFHSVFALSVFLLLMLKLVFNRFYRVYYEHIRHLGLITALLALLMVGTSGGYYLSVTKFGRDLTVERETYGDYKEARIPPPGKMEEPLKPSSDPASIKRGKDLYQSECTLCHDPNSRKTVVGPGHQGILKRDNLPVSGREATPENIRRQLREPYARMPSFDYLSEREVADLIAYLNTL